MAWQMRWDVLIGVIYINTQDLFQSKFVILWKIYIKFGNSRIFYINMYDMLIINNINYQKLSTKIKSITKFLTFQF